MLHSTAHHPTKPVTPLVRHLDARLAKRRKELEVEEDDSFSDEEAESVSSEAEDEEGGKGEERVVRDGEHGEGEGMHATGVMQISLTHGDLGIGSTASHYGGKPDNDNKLNAISGSVMLRDYHAVPVAVAIFK